jgi:hypothetical protein
MILRKIGHGASAENWSLKMHNLFDSRGAFIECSLDELAALNAAELKYYGIVKLAAHACEATETALDSTQRELVNTVREHREVARALQELQPLTIQDLQRADRG